MKSKKLHKAEQGSQRRSWYFKSILKYHDKGVSVTRNLRLFSVYHFNANSSSIDDNLDQQFNSSIGPEGAGVELANFDFELALPRTVHR